MGFLRENDSFHQALHLGREFSWTNVISVPLPKRSRIHIRPPAGDLAGTKTQINFMYLGVVALCTLETAFLTKIFVSFELMYLIKLEEER